MCEDGNCSGGVGGGNGTPVCKFYRRIMQVANDNNATFNDTLMAVMGKSGKHGHGWFETVLPIISFLGIVGNILNLLVLTRRRMLSSMDRLEKSATYGLVALALSDMIFCLAVFPHSFVGTELPVVDGSHRYQLYYKLYGLGVVNLFLMISTWLVVTMSINRYIVVVYPLHARSTLSTSRTILVIVVVWLISALITSPFFIHIEVELCLDAFQHPMFGFRPRFKGKVAKCLNLYMQWIWAIVADFIPIGILAVCNTRLIWELKKATVNRKRTAHGQKVRDSSHKVTLTLVIIVLMLLFLVSPSEILRYINPYAAWGKLGQTIAQVTNMLQATNFAFNFVLYCAVSAAFRQTFKAMFSRCVKDPKGDKSEMHSMLTHAGSSAMDKTMMTNDDLSKAEMHRMLTHNSNARHENKTNCDDFD